MKNNKGFTLIELLIVIVIIISLAVTVFVALDAATRLKDAKDARRAVDAETILTAIHASIIDNRGTLPSGLTAGMVETQLGTAISGCTLATGGCDVSAPTDCVDLSTPLVKYLKSMPVDPKSGTDLLTQYSVIVDTNGIVTVRACGKESATGNNISTSR